jgi:hypothetical protein
VRLHFALLAGLFCACGRFGYDLLDPPGGTSANIDAGASNGSHHAGNGTSSNASAGSTTVADGGSPNDAGPSDAGANYAFNGDAGRNGEGGNDAGANGTGGSAPGGNGSGADTGAGGNSVAGNDMGGNSVAGNDMGGNGAGVGGNNAAGNGAATNASGGNAAGGDSGTSGNSAAGNDAGGNDAGSGGTLNEPSTLRDVCRFTNVVIVEGTASSDTLVSQDVAVALGNACGGSRTTRQVSQDAVGVLDTSGRPLIGPAELALMSGGKITQKATAYLELNDTPIYVSTGKTHYLGYTRAGTRLFSILNSEFTASHDVAILAVTYEPVSQTFVFDSFGFNAIGTRVGGYYFANMLAPNLSNDTHKYYVIEWTDEDGDMAPSSEDQYVVLASG